MTLDFSRAGAVAAVKEFIVSLVKTALVAAIAYAAFRLDNVHIGLTSGNYALYTGLLIVGRALVSSLNIWVTTLPGATNQAPAETVLA